jgi:glyoxylase-like metal-dependent hydrolase (beta-lactamase superfamily II)
MDSYTIQPLHMGTLLELDHGIFTLNRKLGSKISPPIISWLLQAGGRQILVDTGAPPSNIAARHHVPVEYTSSVEDVLRRAGVEPASVEVVVFTHLHWDHCWNLELFPNATFVVQERELQYAVNPLPPHRALYDLGLGDLIPPWSRIIHRMRVINGDRELAPGVTAHLLPGHTPGFQGVGVETTRGLHLIGGDNVALYWNWEHRHPSGHFVNMAEYYRSFDRMATLSEVILPGHDPGVFADPRVRPLARAAERQ